MKELCADLKAEQDALDAIVSGVAADGWNRPTPAKGWTVADQIGHLAFFDERATMAISDPSAFDDELGVAGRDIDAYLGNHLEAARQSSHAESMLAWRDARVGLLRVLVALDPSDRLPWYGPEMSARSFATARLMETWAHGQDVVDALGVARRPTRRLQHIALLGVKTYAWSFVVNDLPVPSDRVNVALTGPDGGIWAWGDESCTNSVRGDAEEFCLVVTQRRNLQDTSLSAEGPVANQWMSIAQAFAGPPGTGRKRSSS